MHDKCLTHHTFSLALSDFFLKDKSDKSTLMFNLLEHMFILLIPFRTESNSRYHTITHGPSQLIYLSYVFLGIPSFSKTKQTFKALRMNKLVMFSFFTIIPC